MKHKIFVGYSKEQIEAKFPDWQIGSFTGAGISALRDAVDSFVRFSCEKHSLLVNTKNFSSEHFSVFLKALESPDIEGSFWFYDTPLWGYEFTVRSRCEVDFLTDSSYTEEVKQLLTENEAFTHDNIMSMAILQTYGKRFAWIMLKQKEAFMDMIFAMEMTDNFSLFKTHLDKVDLGYVELYIEWLDRSPLFSKTQLMKAPFLRDELLLGMLEKQFPVIRLRDMKLFFLLMLTYRLMRM
jgi:hypothetical protein